MAQVRRTGYFRWGRRSGDVPEQSLCVTVARDSQPSSQTHSNQKNVKLSHAKPHWVL